MDNKGNQGRALALWGAWLQVGLILGILGMVIEMIRSFRLHRESTVSAEELAIEISAGMNLSMVGMLASLVGMILLLVALFYSKYRAPWFFWFMAIYAGLSLLAIPIGTVIGIIVLVHIILRRDEFRSGSQGVVDPVA